jgi:hypothetical protein
VGSAGYNVFVLLHVICVIVGYGAVAVDSLATGQQRRFSGPEAQAVAQAGYGTSVKLATRVLYGVPIFGIVAVSLSKGDVSMGEAWISAGFGLWLASIAVLHAVVVPGRRRSLVVLGELAGLRADDHVTTVPPQARELSRLGRRIALGNWAVQLLGLAAVAVMIWKPGR